MPNPAYPQPIPTSPALDPAFDSLTSAEQREAWWRGSDDEQAVQAGDDVEWATEEHFPSGLHRSRLKDEDWARVAYFIAKGVSVTEVAKHFGVSRTTIWRGMQRSSGLRRRILSERRMLQRESDNRFAALRDAVVTGLIEAISAGNVRVLLWAAKRMDLGGSILRAAAGDAAPSRPRRDRAPAPVRAILNRAAEQADAPVPPAPPPPAPKPAPAPAPESRAAKPAKGTKPAKPAASPRPANSPRKPASRTLAPRRAWEPLRRLLACRRPPCPPLADHPDSRVTDTLLQNCRYQGLGRPVCDNDGPLSPYRPLRDYSWP
ncbi:MAG: helix-turn-helix domain-containing protein [Niveispirillum sp.]|uniref:helix-turn-helix domain-containing protein n=1 Tax=Niveispirillum sp. TaxID=1917217 RepID=UPI00403707F2